MIWRTLLLSLILAIPVWAGASRTFTTDYIDFGDPHGSTPMSYVAWVKSNDTANIQAIISHADNTTTDNNTCEMRLRGDQAGDPVECACGVPAATTVSQSTTGYTSGVWIHIACTFINDIDTQIYINGVSEDNDANAGASFPTSANETDVGARPESTRIFHFSGDIAHASIYSKELSALEVKELMYKPESISDSRILYAPIFGVDSPEIDLSGNGNTGTVSGTVASSDGPPIMLGGQN